MLTHNELRKGVKIVLDQEPYEVLDAQPLKKAQRRVVIQAKIKNLISGSVFSRNFHQGDAFEEAEIKKFKTKFLYQHRQQFFFCHEQNPAQRFSLTENQIGSQAKLLKPGQIVEGLLFHNQIISISLPIKIQLKVIESPPGFQGERSQPGTKIVTLESGAKINAPLFINAEDIIEINTEKGEYVRRIEK